MTPEKEQVAEALRAARAYLQDGITHKPGKHYQICTAIEEAAMQGMISAAARDAAQQYVMTALHPSISVTWWLERARCVNARERGVYVQYLRGVQSRSRTSPVHKPPGIVNAVMYYRHCWIEHMLKEL